MKDETLFLHNARKYVNSEIISSLVQINERCETLGNVRCLAINLMDNILGMFVDELYISNLTHMLIRCKAW